MSSRAEPPAAAARTPALTSSPRASVSPSRARSGSSSSAQTGRGASGHAAAARSAARAARADAAADCRSGTTGPTTSGPAPNRPANRAAALSGSSVPPSSTTSRLPCTPASTSRRARLASVRRSSISAAVGLLAPDHPGDHGDGGGGPAQRRRPRVQRLLGLAAHQGVDHQGLQPRVPRPARLRGPRVDLRRAEGDLPGVPEHGLAQLRLAAGRRQLVDLRLHHVDDDPHHLHRLLQPDRPGQLARRRAEHLARDRGPVPLGMADPVHERRDPGLRDQPDPRPVLRRHGPEPGQPLVHRRDGGGPEAAHRPLDPRHGLLVPVRRPGTTRPNGSWPRRVRTRTARAGCPAPAPPSRPGTPRLGRLRVRLVVDGQVVEDVLALGVARVEEYIRRSASRMM